MAAEKIIWDGYFIKEANNNQCDEEENYMDGELTDFILHEFELNYDGNGLVKGAGTQEGSNEQENISHFTIDGQFDSNTKIVKFKKTINNSTTYFTGGIEADVILGNWKEDQNGPDVGTFNLKRILLKPGWNGYYVQYSHHYMNFEHFNVERAPEGKVTGGGADEVGQFEINGSFIYNQNKVKFVKQYLGQHAIYYSGTLEGNVVRGFWGFSVGSPQEKFRLELYE